MIGELIRNNPNAGKKNYSIIHWQTGEPTEEGEYLVQLSEPVKTAFEIDEWLGTHDEWSTFATSRIIAWCKLSDINRIKKD